MAISQLEPQAAHPRAVEWIRLHEPSERACLAHHFARSNWLSFMHSDNKNWRWQRDAGVGSAMVADGADLDLQMAWCRSELKMKAYNTNH